MSAFPVPRKTGSIRVPVVEMTCYQLEATLVFAKQEADGDYHLVLSDAGQTMIGEIPNPPFVSTISPWLSQIIKCRARFDILCPGADKNDLHPNIRVTVTGVGFWDNLHGQTGVAKNGVELHPILSIEPI